MKEIRQTLRKERPNHSIIPLKSREAINRKVKEGEYMVYILAFNGKPIVLGYGRYKRAKVIFDDIETRTSHYKALLVRAYHLFGEGDKFKRFIIKCADGNDSKKEAEKIERLLKGRANKRAVFDDVKDAFFKDIKKSSKAELFLKLAWHSSFDGLKDLYTWEKNNLIDKNEWGVIKEHLELEKIKIPKARKKNKKS